MRLILLVLTSSILIIGSYVLVKDFYRKSNHQLAVVEPAYQSAKEDGELDRNE